MQVFNLNRRLRVVQTLVVSSHHSPVTYRASSGLPLGPIPRGIGGGGDLRIKAAHRRISTTIHGDNFPAAETVRWASSPSDPQVWTTSARVELPIPSRGGYREEQ